MPIITTCQGVTRWVGLQFQVAVVMGEKMLFGLYGAFGWSTSSRHWKKKLKWHRIASLVSSAYNTSMVPPYIKLQGWLWQMRQIRGSCKGVPVNKQGIPRPWILLRQTPEGLSRKLCEVIARQQLNPAYCSKRRFKGWIPTAWLEWPSSPLSLWGGTVGIRIKILPTFLKCAVALTTLFSSASIVRSRCCFVLQQLISYAPGW